MSHQWQLKIYLIISSSLLTKKKLSKNQNNIVKRITKPSQSRTPQATQSNSNFSANQSELRSVPNRRSSRNQNNEERNYRMNTLSKSGSKNVVTMDQSSDYSSQESSKMCLFEPRVFSDTQDIADELKNRRATLVNLQRIDKVSAKRIIDF